MATLPIKALRDEKGTVFVPFIPQLANGFQHNVLEGRNAVDSHPVSAITGLDTTLSSIQSRLQGMTISYTFATEQEMWDRIANDPEWVAQLEVGNNLYIIDVDSPDYWWDGTTAQVMEVTDINLADYYRKSEVDSRDASTLQSANLYTDGALITALEPLGVLNNKTKNIVNTTGTRTNMTGEVRMQEAGILLSGSTYASITLTNTTNGTIGRIGWDSSNNHAVYSGVAGISFRPVDHSSATGMMTLSTGGILNLPSGGAYTINGENILLRTYPVGAIYLSISSANPGTLFGGTWAAFGQGRTLIGMGSNGTTNYATVQATGGAETHTHTQSAHTHTFSGAHTHTIASHAHTSAAHTHSFSGAHTHTIASHTHTSASHNHSFSGAHTHGLDSNGWAHISGGGGSAAYMYWTERSVPTYQSNFSMRTSAVKGKDNIGGDTVATTLGGATASGTASGTTGSTTPGATGGTALTTASGTASGTTGSTTPGNTGGTSLTTDSGTASGTTSSAGGTTVNASDSRSPWITVYMWLRTA